MKIIEELFKKYNFKNTSVGFSLVEKDKKLKNNEEDNLDSSNELKLIDRLEENLFLLKSFQKIAKIGSWSWDIKNGKVHRSSEIYDIFNLKEKMDNLTFDNYISFIPKNERERVIKVINNALKKGEDYEVTHHIEITKGDIRLIKGIGKTIFDENNKAVKMIGIVQDITNDIKTKKSLETFSFLFDSTNDSILMTSTDGVITEVNDSMLKVTGYSREDLVGFKSSIMKSNQHNKEFYSEMWTSLVETGSWSGEIWNRKKDGTIYPVWSRIIRTSDFAGEDCYIAIYTDLSESHKKNETIRDLSEKDLLTGLPNWRVFRDRLKQMLSTRKSNEEVLLSVIKLLNLGDMNELKGSEAGDEILTEFALRVKTVLDANITFARLEGTEFAILFKSEDSLREFDNIMDMITFSLRETFYDKKHKDHFFNIVSGTVIAPTDGETPDILMKNVIATLHKAKENKSHYFFSKDFKEKSSRRILLTNELRKEIRRFQHIKPYYQAKLDKKGEVRGAEALARWFHPEIGFISPAEFIPIAEESGMISELGEFIFEETCKNISSFEGIPDNFKVAVNLSSVQLANKNLPFKIESILNKHKVDYKHIELEVTESMLQDNLDDTVDTLNKLRDMGVTIALDDFGTGYSSLSYLKELPIDILKIDQSFIFSMLKSKKDQAIVDTIITLGKNLDMKLVAEGVETKEDVKALTKKGCDYFQGYYFHKPSPWDGFSTLMDD